MYVHMLPLPNLPNIIAGTMQLHMQKAGFAKLPQIWKLTDTLYFTSYY